MELRATWKLAQLGAVVWCKKQLSRLCAHDIIKVMATKPIHNEIGTDDINIFGYCKNCGIQKVFVYRIPRKVLLTVEVNRQQFYVNQTFIAIGIFLKGVYGKRDIPTHLLGWKL